MGQADINENASISESKTKYSIIHVKDTTYLQRPCYAISFQDVS